MTQARRGRAGWPRGASARRARANPRRAYTYIELLVTLGILTAVMGLLLPLVGKSRASAQSIKCVSQLRQMGSAFLQYAVDNDRTLPDPFNTGVSWEQLLRPYVQNTEVYRCTADQELYPSIGSSYDWRDTGRSDTTLAGKPIDDAKLHTNPVLAFEALPGWHARGKINVVFLNGTATSTTEEDCLADIQTPLRYPILVPKPSPPRGGNGGQ
ncbi:MAG TPA: type II secretion system protein [Tepidisphaeraceae bacterium]|nr:type II secretion system protein [Tepidisphaeraceae bacterium]